MRTFNVEGTCVPDENYMVDITGKLKQIKTMVDEKKYFTINRGRQYGKTTTLFVLEHFLKDDYIVISISFEGLGDESFANSAVFCQAFLKLIWKALRFSGVSEAYRARWLNENVKSFDALSDHVTDLCDGHKLILMIDEVDKTTNNRTFLNFLSKLREKFLARKVKKDFTFHSVILAGVYDIRNIKLKMIQEGLYVPTTGETTIHNSPWNIAADFEVEMSFSISETETMLMEYEADYKTGMNIFAVATEIYTYTSGYPVLVSKICKYIDEKLEKDWTPTGVRNAVKLVLKESGPLFESLIKNLTSNEEFARFVYHILMIKTKIPFNINDPLISLGVRYGYFSDLKNRGVGISNKIFEICLTNYFVNQDFRAKMNADTEVPDKEGIIENGKFNMQVCLEKFSKYYHQQYHQQDVKFFEHEARKLFLLFVSAIINGSGFAYMESEQGDKKRTDVIVNYLTQQFIVELKIWKGKEAHEQAQNQLLGYMDKLSVTEGYLLTFDFRKKKERRQAWNEFENGQRIFDVRV